MIYKLYGIGTVSTTTDGVATLDIQNDGFITGVLLNIHAAGMDLLDKFARIEVSFMSSNTFTVNDVRGSIAMHIVVQSFLTTGGGVGSSVSAISGLMVPVEAGERIHMHTVGATGVTPSGTIYLYVEDDTDAKQRPKRRLR